MIFLRKSESIIEILIILMLNVMGTIIWSFLYCDRNYPSVLVFMIMCGMVSIIYIIKLYLFIRNALR